MDTTDILEGQSKSPLDFFFFKHIFCTHLVRWKARGIRERSLDLE